MAKSITVQRKIFKLNSRDIRNYTEMVFHKENKNLRDGIKKKTINNSEWKYDIDYKDITNSESIISLGESHTLRMIDDILGVKQDIRDDYDSRKKAIKNIKRGVPIEKWDEKSSVHFGKTLSILYNEIMDIQFEPNYVSIIFDRDSDFKLMNKNGLKINGLNYRRLYGTSAGVKNNTVVYVSDKKVGDETLHGLLLKRLENDYDKSKKLVPSKYEAYLSLNSSASTKVFSDFSADDILVVPDQVVNIITPATLIGECIGDKTNITEDERYILELEQSDGGGIVDKSVAKTWSEDLKLDYIPSVFIARNSFFKGTLATMDISELNKRFLKKGMKVYDVWNMEKPEGERKEVDMSSIKMIIPTSMLKLWKCYDSIEDYLKKCKKNKHTFSITKTSPKVLENERTLNYQFVQSLHLNERDIDGLIKNTVDSFHDILTNDFRKMILYARGASSTTSSVIKSDNDCFKSIMIDKRMMNDPHIRKTLYKMIKKSIDNAKIAKIKTRGNFQMILPDLIWFYKHSIGLKDSVGSLKEGEFYSKYWNDLGVDEVVAMRAPACTHANFRKIKMVHKNDELELYKYITTAIVFNGYDSTVESLSGAD